MLSIRFGWWYIDEIAFVCVRITPATVAVLRELLLQPDPRLVNSGLCDASFADVVLKSADPAQ
jgi:hypothetical protein